MNKLLFVFFIGLVGCQPVSNDIVSDDATHVAGTYAVQFLQVNNTTVWSIQGANKLGVSDFYVEVKRLGTDSISITRSYTRNGQGRGLSNFARVHSQSNLYSLTAQKYVAAEYESRIINGTFTERTISTNVNFLLKGWAIDSSANSTNEVFISAKKI